MHIQTTFDVKDDEITNLLDMMSRSSTYWAAGVGKLAYESTTAALLKGTKTLKIKDYEDGEKSYTLDLAAIKRGLKVMAQKFPKHFASICSEDTDGETADVLLQCALLGDIVYG